MQLTDIKRDDVQTWYKTFGIDFNASFAADPSGRARLLEIYIQAGTTLSQNAYQDQMTSLVADQKYLIELQIAEAIDTMTKAGIPIPPRS